MFLIRNCPQCQKEISYKNKNNFEKANKNNVLCQSCIKKLNQLDLILICDDCGKELHYKNLKVYEKAKEKGQLCKDCTYKKNYRVDKLERNCPQCNSFIYYKDKKTFNNAIKNNNLCLSCIRKNNMNDNLKQKLSKASKGQNNPMANRSFFDVWLEKYGEEIANQKLIQFKNKCSQRNKGENNPMYGKPSPKKSGNGYSGYYKGNYFRSILELSYLKYLLDNNIKFESCENKKYRVEYQLDNKKQTYFPDFYLLDTQEIIEIKPQNLLNNKINKLKFEAAINKYGNKFKVLTENNFNKLDVNDTYRLYINKEIVFDKNYEQKFIEYYKKEINK